MVETLRWLLELWVDFGRRFVRHWSGAGSLKARGRRRRRLEPWWAEQRVGYEANDARGVRRVREVERATGRRRELKLSEVIEGALGRWRMRRGSGRCVVVSTGGGCWPLWVEAGVEVALRV